MHYGFNSTAHLQLEDTGLIKVHDNLSLIDPRLSADATSVLGARISRSRDLNKRAVSMFNGVDIKSLFWSHELQKPVEDVSNFLKSNLGDYGHSSIADMAPVAFYIHGIPLSVCWLFEDFSLFKGMETSTRAVSYTPKTPQAMFCDNPDHAAYLTAYEQLGSEGTGYKYDVSRYMLPSSVPQGVVICGSARDIFNHVRNLRCFPWLDPLIDWCCQGLQLLAPITWEQLRHQLDRPRPPIPYKWRAIPAQPLQEMVVRVSHTDLQSFSLRIEPSDLPIRPNTKTYMDSIFADIQVEIGFNISWVSSRDFHRHRPGGDWLLSIPTKNQRWMFVGMQNDQLQLMNPGIESWEVLSQQHKLQWEDLSKIPSGTLVRMERRMPLNYLVYMLELRAKTPGRNFEYAAIATKLMHKLVGELWWKQELIYTQILKTQRLMESYEEMQNLNIQHMKTMQKFPFN